MAKLFANSRDPEKMMLSATSELNLHCLPITLLWVSRLKFKQYLVQLFSFTYVMNERLMLNAVCSNCITLENDSSNHQNVRKI